MKPQSSDSSGGSVYRGSVASSSDSRKGGTRPNTTPITSVRVIPKGSGGVLSSMTSSMGGLHGSQLVLLGSPGKEHHHHQRRMRAPSLTEGEIEEEDSVLLGDEPCNTPPSRSRGAAALDGSGTSCHGGGGPGGSSSALQSRRRSGEDAAEQYDLDDFVEEDLAPPSTDPHTSSSGKKQRAAAVPAVSSGCHRRNSKDDPAGAVIVHRPGPKRVVPARQPTTTAAKKDRRPVTAEPALDVGPAPSPAKDTPHKHEPLPAAPGGTGVPKKATGTEGAAPLAARDQRHPPSAAVVGSMAKGKRAPSPAGLNAKTPSTRPNAKPSPGPPTLSSSPAPSTKGASIPLAVPVRKLRVKVAHKAIIGKGSFGVVYQAMDLDTNHIIACKEMCLVKGGGAVDQVPLIQQEIAMLKQLDHPNIVKCLGDDCDDKFLRIYMEYITGGSISSILRMFGALQEKQASIFTHQMLNGLAYLHERHICHRDLKGDNLLIDTQGVLKLADFGTAKELASQTTTIAGTAYFMAPEVIQGIGHGVEADVWSVGCCVIEMITGKPPFSHLKNQYAIMMHVAENSRSLEEIVPKGITAACASFLRRCLVREPAARATVRELLQHEWIVNPPEAHKRDADGGGVTGAGAVGGGLLDTGSIQLAGQQSIKEARALFRLEYHHPQHDDSEGQQQRYNQSTTSVRGDVVAVGTTEAPLNNGSVVVGGDERGMVAHSFNPMEMMEDDDDEDDAFR